MGELNNLLEETIAKLGGEKIITVEDLKQRLTVLISNTEVKEDKTTADKLNEIIDGIAKALMYEDYRFNTDKHLMHIINDIGNITISIRSRWDDTYDDKILGDTLLNKLGDLVWNCISFNMYTDEYTTLEILASILNNENKVADTSLYAVRKSLYKIHRRHIMEVMNLVYSLGFTFDDVYKELISYIEPYNKLDNEGR